MIKRLPDSEFEVMEIIWDNPSPITTLQIMEKIEPSRPIKMQTLLTMLMRLVEKGFLTSGRAGRERNYCPAVSKQDYMRVETDAFMARHYIHSMGSLIKTFYGGNELSAQDLQDLKDFLSDHPSRGRG